MEDGKMNKLSVKEAALTILKAGAVDIRKVPKKITNEEVNDLPLENRPFLYSSGNWGPGYIMIKGLVGRKRIMKDLVRNLAVLLAMEKNRIDFIAGNVSGGIIPAWILSENLKILLKREFSVPFVYIRETRKKGGQKEIVTGIANNWEIPLGSHGVVVEELVNFAETTCNGSEALRSLGYPVEQAATILFYDNPKAIENLKNHGIKITYLLTVKDLLQKAYSEKLFPTDAIQDYMLFLQNPLDWQAERGLTPDKEGGTK